MLWAGKEEDDFKEMLPGNEEVGHSQEREQTKQMLRSKGQNIREYGRIHKLFKILLPSHSVTTVFIQISPNTNL